MSGPRCRQAASEEAGEECRSDQPTAVACWFIGAILPSARKRVPNTLEADEQPEGPARQRVCVQSGIRISPGVGNGVPVYNTQDGDEVLIITEIGVLDMTVTLKIGDDPAIKVRGGSPPQHRGLGDELEENTLGGERRRVEKSGEEHSKEKRQFADVCGLQDTIATH